MDVSEEVIFVTEVLPAEFQELGQLRDELLDQPVLREGRPTGIGVRPACTACPQASRARCAPDDGLGR